jgi:hypothetical protein
MGWPFITDAASAVEFMMCVGCLLMGVSHILQPGMWRAFFTALHGTGRPALVTRTFMLEFWPALILVTLHQVWFGPGIVLTLYGWALLAKCTLSMLWPDIGMRSLALAQRGDRGFVAGGIGLACIGICAGLALLW